MIISKTPYRVSFLGGGSDLAAFYKSQAGPGAVVSTTIDKYMYVTVNRRFDKSIRMAYTKTEIVDKVEGLEHDLAREAIKMAGLDGGLEITTIGEIPAGTGLGSSSAVTVGLLNALYAYQGIEKSPEDLAQEACQIEIDILGQPIGKQDQFACACGGLNYIQFNPDETVLIEPIKCSQETKKKLNDNLLFFYTGVKRKSEEILNEQKKNTLSQNEKRKILKKMVNLAQQTRDALNKDDLSQFGQLLDQGWQLKKQMASKISNSKIDQWYSAAKKAGALGGKILGAGGGGFLVFYCEKEKQENLIKAMKKLKLQKIQFALTSQESQIKTV